MSSPPLPFLDSFFNYAKRACNLENKDNSFWVSFGKLGGIGFMLVFSVLAGIFLGQKGDEYFNTGSTLTLLGVFFGSAVGFWNMFRMIKKG